MKDLLKNAAASAKKAEDFRENEQNWEEEATFFAPGTTPQYKVIYKDMCEVASPGALAGHGRLGDRERYVIDPSHDYFALSAIETDFMGEQYGNARP